VHMDQRHTFFLLDRLSKLRLLAGNNNREQRSSACLPIGNIMAPGKDSGVAAQRRKQQQITDPPISAHQPKRLLPESNSNKPPAVVEANAVPPQQQQQQTIRSDTRKRSVTIGAPRPRQTASEVLVPVLTACCVVLAVVVGYVYNRYGRTMFMGYQSYDLHHSAIEWKHRLNGTTILLIGGPHRGGTSILWEALSRHPDISGFGNSFATGRDHSEGILMQNVYPDLGVGTETVLKHQRRGTDLPQGVGRYALAKEDMVHLVETNRRVTEQNFAKLLNRFGPYWNLSKPVLVEKSPPTAVMSRFLQALYNIPVAGAVDTDNQELVVGPTTKFLFITRHPLANVYAQQSFLGKNTVPLAILLDNYMQMHRYMLADMKLLRNDPKLIQLEDLARTPRETLAELHRWLGLSRWTWKDCL
jgi:hypothetical protein